MQSPEALLGIELQIIQASTAGEHGSVLTIAACNAGGLGSIVGAILNQEECARN